MRKYIDAGKMLEEYKHSIYDTTDLAEMLNYMPAADVVEKEKYDRLLENALIVSTALQKYQKADVVEVVRCKDCKHADLFYPYCTIWEAAIDGDGYCYKGEKE